MVIQGDEENSVKPGFELLRNDYEGSPPSGNAKLRRDRQDFIPKLNVFLRLRDTRPIFESRRTPALPRPDRTCPSTRQRLGPFAFRQAFSSLHFCTVVHSFPQLNFQIFLAKRKLRVYLHAQIEPGSLKNLTAQLKEGAAVARPLRPRCFCPSSAAAIP